MKYFMIAAEIDEENHIQIPLNETLGDSIALVDIIFVCDKSFKKTEQIPLQISCDEIDSSNFNPDRILKRILLYKRSGHFCLNWSAEQIPTFFKLDSQNIFLNLNFKSLNKSFFEENNQIKVFLTLAIK